MRIFLLLYADDTTLFSETFDGMQEMLNVFSNYCKQWKLEVNARKTKVFFFPNKNLSREKSLY